MNIGHSLVLKESKTSGGTGIETDNYEHHAGGSIYTHSCTNPVRGQQTNCLMGAVGRWLEKVLEGNDPSAEWNRPNSFVQAQWLDMYTQKRLNPADELGSGFTH